LMLAPSLAAISTITQPFAIPARASRNGWSSLATRSWSSPWPPPPNNKNNNTEDYRILIGDRGVAVVFRALERFSLPVSTKTTISTIQSIPFHPLDRPAGAHRLTLGAISLPLLRKKKIRNYVIRRRPLVSR
jgi:hypothetical protein